MVARRGDTEKPSDSCGRKSSVPNRPETEKTPGFYQTGSAASATKMVGRDAVEIARALCQNGERQTCLPAALSPISARYPPLHERSCSILDNCSNRYTIAGEAHAKTKNRYDSCHKNGRERYTTERSS